MSDNKTAFIRIGDFFFKWRNYFVPLFLIAVVCVFQPAGSVAGQEWIAEFMDVIGFFMVLSGLGFRAATIGWAYIKRGGLNKEVYADTLVEGGFFGMCRNPLYVGNMLIYSGIFMIHGNPVAVVFGTAFFYFFYCSIIAAEEFYLRNKFGAAFDDYCARVPRWIPVWSKFEPSTENMRYCFSRAVFKDYSTVFNAFLAIGAIEMTEMYIHHSHAAFLTTSYNWIGFLFILGLATLSVRYFKKNKGKVVAV
jgi:protein-S-isoprenylcysteine O-methyltransferase Ste14